MNKVNEKKSEGSNENIALGNSVKYFRKKSDITGRLLCNIMGRSYGWCNMIEKGKSRITVPDLFKFCELFNVTPNQFYDKYKEELSKIEAQNNNDE